MLAGLESGFHEAQGRRDTMEDAHAIIDDAKTHADLSSFELPYKQIAFYGVFDGHGGVDAAQMVEKHLHKNIFSQEELKGGDVTKALNVGFEKTDATIVEASNKNGWMNGSTAVVGLLLDHQLYIANVGDSEAILVAENADGSLAVENCTTPHKASDPNEKRRIESLGGHVFFGRVFGALAVSRSFGDTKFKMPKTSQNFVSWEPSIKQTELTTAHRFLVLACDGLWDVMNHQEAAEFVNKHRKQGESAGAIANALVREALNKKTEDNVTVIVVFFKWEGRQEGAEAPAAEPTKADTPSDPAPSDSTPADTPAQ